MKPLYILLPVLLASCTTESGEIRKFYNSEIVMPTNMLIDSGKVQLDLELSGQCLKMIVWYDSTECSTCKLDRILDYYDFIDYNITSLTGLKSYFIFSPSKQNLKSFEDYASSVVHYYPIFVDTANQFYKLNPHIPANKLMHSFMLDSENKVVLVGSPILNQAMFDLYKKTIEEMLN